MIISRFNAMGLRYSLSEHPRVNGDQTQITLVGTTKKIVVNHKLERISAMWYKWQMQGAMIQEAFKELNPEEREFLMTGITPAEWNETFAQEEE